MLDRTVHATGPGGRRIVRYNRAGKWYIEMPGCRRQHRSINEAALVAALWVRTDQGQVHYGLPGGSRFDALIRRFVGHAGGAS